MCQLEQVKDHQQRLEMKKDFDKAWHEILSRDHHNGIHRDQTIARHRWHENQSVQNHLKDQMADKIQRGLEVWEEINEERKRFAEMSKEDFQLEQQRLRHEQVVRQSIGEDATVKKFFNQFSPLKFSHEIFLFQRQIRENYQTRKDQLERELKRDQMINEKIRKELESKQKSEKEEREQFRRDVFLYLDHLMTTRHHNKNVECEKLKLIEDIRKKTDENEWNDRCEARQKRLLVNQVARLGQVHQMRSQKKAAIEEAAKEQEENSAFNIRELKERKKIQEAKWQQRLKAYDYGRELIEQRKSEELRDLAEKQKLSESLMLAAQERERHESMGNEFVKSYQDVLAIHPNLRIIQKGKHN